MSQEHSQLEILEAPEKRCCNMTYMMCGLLGGIGLTILLVVAFWFGRQSVVDVSEESTWNGIPHDRIPPEFLSASGSHGGSNMAVCTGMVGDDAEGFFALDFLTGDLKGWVYYPKVGAFGGLFMTNVLPQLGPTSKNPEYLLVSGQTSSVAIGGNVRLAGSLIYVVDMRSGFFAAYTAPWNKSLESSAGAPQGGQLIFVSGGQIRESMLGARKPVAPQQPGAGAQAANQGANNQGAANPGVNPGAAANPGAANDPNKPANPNNKKPK